VGREEDSEECTERDLADGYWVVGPVFGAAVLIYNWSETRKSLVSAAAFLAASTLIYALVYRVSQMRWGSDSALFEYVIGSFPIAIVMGSILLPLADRLLLKKSGALPMKQVCLLIGGFYFITLLSYLCDVLGIQQHIPWLIILIAVWQGTYLTTSA
jgi:uncharacterized membrane protein